MFSHDIGVLNVLITVTNIRKKAIKAIPEFMQEAITVGIGLFITYIGLKSSGLLEFSVSAVNSVGIALGADVVPQLATFSTSNIILALIGLVITAVLVSKKVKNSYLISILLTTIVAFIFGVTTLPDFANYSFIPSIEPTFLKLDFNTVRNLELINTIKNNNNKKTLFKSYWL